MTSKKIYKECMVRIGLKPYLFQLREEISFDIDCLPDFRMAEVLYQSVRFSSNEEKLCGVTASKMYQLLRISFLIDNLKTFYQCNPEATRTKGYLERFAKHMSFYGSDLYPDQ